MSDRTSARGHGAAAGEVGTQRAAEEGGDASHPIDQDPTGGGAVVTIVDILDGPMIQRMLDAHASGQRGPVLVIIIPKYAPKGTEGWVYEVTKVNRTTVSLAPMGGGRDLRAHAISLVEADEQDIAAYDKLRAAGRTVALPEGVHSGTIVRICGPDWRQDPNALWSVIALKGMSNIAIARLGGDKGRTWPTIPASYVSAVILPSGLRDAMTLDPRFRDRS